MPCSAGGYLRTGYVTAVHVGNRWRIPWPSGDANVVSLKEVARPLGERLSRVEPRCRAWHAAARSREVPRLLAGIAGSETGRAGALLVPGLDRRRLPDNSLWSEASIESSCGAVFPERSSRRKCGTGTATG